MKTEPPKQNIELPPEPPKQNRTDKYDANRAAIPKRLAAIEVIRVIRNSNTVATTGIVGYLILSIVAPFSKTAGAIVAGVLSMGLSWYLYRGIKEKRTLEHKYNIIP